MARKELSISSASSDLPIDYRNEDAKDYYEDPEIETINADISIKDVEKSIILWKNIETPVFPLGIAALRRRNPSEKMVAGSIPLKGHF